MHTLLARVTINPRLPEQMRDGDARRTVPLRVLRAIETPLGTPTSSFIVSTPACRGAPVVDPRIPRGFPAGAAPARAHRFAAFDFARDGTADASENASDVDAIVREAAFHVACADDRIRPVRGASLHVVARAWSCVSGVVRRPLSNRLSTELSVIMAVHLQ